MNVKSYLTRIGITEEAAVNKDFLFRLHEQHLLEVPFENLDVHYKIPIVLDHEHLYQKIVVQGRGGFCYELNGLFAHLLKTVGFSTRLISCRVHQETETYSPEYDHMAIIVALGKHSYLLDVGFGDFIQKPLPITYDKRIHDANGTFVFRKQPQGYTQLCRLKDVGWVPEYIFDTKARRFNQFNEMCAFHQFSPKSHMTKKKMISQATPDGRITLTESDLTLTKNGVKSKMNSANLNFESLVKQYFDIDLE